MLPLSFPGTFLALISVNRESVRNQPMNILLNLHTLYWAEGIAGTMG